MEIEKKKTRPTKRVSTGPSIRYHSISMPLIEEINAPDKGETTKNTDVEELNESGVSKMEIE